MSRPRLLAVLATSVSVAAGGVAGPAYAADRTCRGTIGAVSVDGTVNVPDGASCTLAGTRVKSDVKVGRGSSLLTRGGSVGGNVQGDGALQVRIFDTPVTGNIQLKKTTKQIVIGPNEACKVDPLVDANIQLEENSATIAICNMTIREDLQLVKNTGTIGVFNNVIGENFQVYENTKIVRMRGNRVGEDMQLFKNRGGLEVFRNSVRQNLQCTENSPAPIGSGNTAGQKEGQCAGL